MCVIWSIIHMNKILQQVATYHIHIHIIRFIQTECLVRFSEYTKQYTA